MARFSDTELAELALNGWRYELENKDRLTKRCYSRRQLLQNIKDSELEPAATIDTRPWNPIENQANQGACQGHMLSTVLEGLYVYATGMQVQLSRACAYYRSQAEDGIRGDSGSTLEGGIAMATRDGVCRESVWPYPSRYDATPPSGWKDDAKNYRLGSTVPVKSADDAAQFLRHRIGFIGFGILWPGSWSNLPSNGIFPNYQIPSRPGGHAVAGMGVEPFDNGNRFVVLIPNSWGATFGVNGWGYLEDRNMDRMLAANKWNMCFGYSDMHTPAPRPAEATL